MPNGKGTQPLKDFQNSNLNFKLAVATFQIYFGNSPTIPHHFQNISKSIIPEISWFQINVSHDLNHYLVS
jgi:hypothetical protein